MPELYNIILMTPLILLSLVVHEFAHAQASFKLGDPTPQLLGRLTLNPLAHLDPFGTLMLLVTMLKGFGFGWAKPVTIDSRYYKNPLQGSMLVALAGPAANIGLALLFGLPLRLFHIGFWPSTLNTDFAFLLIEFFYTGLLLNLSLAFFNLLPIPPLDGSRLVRYLLRGQAALWYNRVERYGFLLLFALLILFDRPFNHLFSTVLAYGVFLITGF